MDFESLNLYRSINGLSRKRDGITVAVGILHRSPSDLWDNTKWLNSPTTDFRKLNKLFRF